jgi:hypothetical protein
VQPAQLASPEAPEVVSERPLWHQSAFRHPWAVRV